MSDKAHVLDWLPAYALGSLDEAEAQLVADHLRDCPSCQAELAAYQGVIGQLALPLPAVTPPADLKQQLLERIQPQSGFAAPPAPVPRPSPQKAHQPHQPRRRSRPTRQLAWVFATLLLIFGVSFATLFFWLQSNRSEQPAMLIEPQGMRAIALSSSETAPQASGFVIIGADGRNGALIVDKFPTLDPAQTYQVWLERDGQYISSSLFTVDETGYRGTRLEAPDSLLSYSTLQITVEPLDGSPQPSGAPIMHGSLQNPQTGSTNSPR